MMETKRSRFRAEVLQFACWTIAFVATSFLPLISNADGCFVFVWHKEKDINEPTQKAIIVYDAGREDLILQVKYEGPAEEFGWLVPVPSLPTVQKASMDCFYELSRYTQELWEPPEPLSRGAEPVEPVKVVEIKTVGAYDVAVLSAKDTGALQKWLEANHFSFPPDKSAIIDSYVKKQWYFVAAKIHANADGFQLVSEKLASGELHPLHLSFSTGKCVFPLKISAVNGKPSEVQVYVLSPEPLLEKTVFDEDLPKLYSNDVALAERKADNFARVSLNQLRATWGNLKLPPRADGVQEAERIRHTLRAWGNPTNYTQVTSKQLPDCGKEIPRLTQDSWWLTKQTWTFQPEEMQDLEFQPAIPALAEKLGSPGGYHAAAYLVQCGSNAVPALLDALQSSNSLVRSNAMSIFGLSYIYTTNITNDPRFHEIAKGFIKDPDPEMRVFALEWASFSPEELLAAMHDQDFRVGAMAGDHLRETMTNGPEGEKYMGAVQEMLHDKNEGARAAAMYALMRARIAVPRGDLLQFFTCTNVHVVANVYGLLTGRGGSISNEEAVPLLQNSDQSVRLIGLQIIYKNAQKSGIDLLLPLLKDKDKLIAVRAGATLRALTGQHLTEEQADQWEKWWNDNKANFVVQLHPEELEPLMARMRQQLRSGRALSDPRPLSAPQ